VQGVKSTNQNNSNQDPFNYLNFFSRKSKTIYALTKLLLEKTPVAQIGRDAGFLI